MLAGSASVAARSSHTSSEKTSGLRATFRRYFNASNRAMVSSQPQKFVPASNCANFRHATRLASCATSSPSCHAGSSPRRYESIRGSLSTSSRTNAS